MAGADVVAGVAIASAIAGTGTAVYEATKPGQDFHAKPPAPPQRPQMSSLDYTQKQADEQARSAGGTILSNQNSQKPVGDAANATRKTLLGT